MLEQISAKPDFSLGSDTLATIIRAIWTSLYWQKENIYFLQEKQEEQEKKWVAAFDDTGSQYDSHIKNAVPRSLCYWKIVLLCDSAKHKQTTAYVDMNFEMYFNYRNAQDLWTISVI